jgi:hypothetical protein
METVEKKPATSRSRSKHAAAVNGDLSEVLDDLEAAGFERDEMGKVLHAASAEASIDPLLAWARERGTVLARAGEGAQSAAEEALRFARAVSERLPVNLQADELSSALVGATVEGYIEADGGQAHGHVPVEVLEGRVAELTALHRVIGAANSSLKLNDMLTETAQAVVDVTHADVCSVFIY